MKNYEVFASVKNYLVNTNLGPATLTIENGILTIGCSGSVSEKEMIELRNVIFTGNYDNINVSQRASSLMQKNDNTIIVNLKIYDIFTNIYEKLVELGVTMLEASFDPNDIYFTYSLSGRSVLNYTELGILQDLIDPSIAEHDSIRVMGNGGNSYTLRANVAFAC